MRVDAPRDALSPREVATRSGFSYHAILRAIRRGDLAASEPVRGHYRIDVEEYERWRHTPRSDPRKTHEPLRSRARTRPPDRGSLAALRAIEGGS